MAVTLPLTSRCLNATVGFPAFLLSAEVPVAETILIEFDADNWGAVPLMRQRGGENITLPSA